MARVLRYAHSASLSALLALITLVSMTSQNRGDDRMSQALALLAPHVIALIDDWARPEFTTKQFIENLLMEETAQAAYLQAVSLWPDFPPNFGQKTVHGLIIPRLLRATGKAQWAGYVHDAAEDDGLGVPAKWRKVRPAPSEPAIG